MHAPHWEGSLALNSLRSSRLSSKSAIALNGYVRKLSATTTGTIPRRSRRLSSIGEKSRRFPRYGGLRTAVWSTRRMRTRVLRLASEIEDAANACASFDERNRE